MTKVLKNILISLCGMFAFLFAGFFFVGCSVDYSKISLVSDRQSVELIVGQSVDITLTIENYQNGFSNKIQVNPRADGQTAVFDVSEPVYVSDNEIRVTVTGVAGGHGELFVKTLEAGKECVVDVYVEQWSSSMEFDNSTLYVSNKTPFVPNSGLFIFDNNTTYKELSYYYLQFNGEFNVNTYSLTELSFEENLAMFSDGVNSVSASIQQFDQVNLVKNETNSLVLSLDGVETEVELQSEFLFLAVYDYSIDNEDYEEIVYDVATVYVLPDINANITGGYMDIGTGMVTFAPIEDEKIVIVPNNNHMSQYVLKVEMENSIANSPLKMNKFQSNDYVDIDFYDYQYDEEEDKTVYYLKISQNAQTQATTDLFFEIFYDIAQGLEDESVNARADFSIDIQIAPTGLTVNGTPEPDRLILYNYYRYPEFGWNELLINVISGYSSSPNFDGVYLTFDETYLDVTYKNITVSSGDSRLYTDLTTPFYIRGKYGTNQISNLVVTVHLKSDIMQDRDEITVDINCSIIAGATSITVDEEYDDNYFYLDYYGGSQNFASQIYADHAFQYSIYTFLSGVDVLNIDTNDDAPYTEVDNRFYLNLTLTPRLTGVGVYRVYLDNGMPIDLTFNVIRTLSSDTTTIQLTNEGNEAVTESYYSIENDADFENTLNIEILNPSTKTGATFGNVAQFTISANVNSDGIRYIQNENSYVSIAKINDIYRISTLDNGMTQIVFTLTGLAVENFETNTEELNLYVNVSSYSLVDEFYMRNGDNYALNNTVYYVTGNVTGVLQEEDESATLTPVVNYVESMNFYQYFFLEEAFVDIFENAIESNGEFIYTLNNNQIYTEIVYEKYNRKFIYFNTQIIYSNDGNSSYATASTVTEVTVTKRSATDDQPQTKTIMLVLTNGLMFLASDFEYVERNAAGTVVATYSVEFSNVFSIGTYGSFDMDSFTYTNNMPAVYNLSLSANLRQRNSTRKYDCQISTSLYQSVESIFLATNLTQLNFSNSELEYSIGVYTYPTTSTNKEVRVEFVRTNGNPYVNMVTWDIQPSGDNNGVFTITISCEDFFREHIDDIVNIQDYLTGRLYIYPTEWGDSYTSIAANLQPVVIDVHYRNGSRANPYLLETAEDIVGINTNETTLKSHYEISTMIDMSTIQNFTPIGILNENGQNVLHGFSGTIIGTGSQAGITNIVVSENNFSATVTNDANISIRYYGLFAQINAQYDIDENDPESDTLTPLIENVIFTGKFDINMNLPVEQRAYVGLLTAVNRGELINVGTRIDASQINMVVGQKMLYFGAVAGVNYGSIIQDFTKYDGTGYNFKVYSDKTIFTDENGKTYIVDDFGEKVFVDNEKYAIDENGDRIKYDNDGNVLLSSRDYTGQNSKNLAYYEGVVAINTSSTNLYAGGIVGASSGVVNRISSDTLKLYGYSAYSAYTLISVSGSSNFNEFNKIYVGGAVGVATYNTGVTGLDQILFDNDIPRSGNAISNLLVGGEVDTSATENYQDAVGGIVGYTDTLNVATINVLKNTSRAFLRANEYVGGIVGYDAYSTNYGDYTEFGSENLIEAVDDGKNSFFVSAIIKHKTLNDDYLPNSEQEKSIFYAIGNATRNSRNYGSFDFNAYSYLKRNLLTVEETEIILTNSASTSNYYGDYIIINVSDDGVRITQSYTFEFKEVDLDLNQSEFAMTQKGETTADVGVYFMYYFSVEGRLNEDHNAVAQDEIEDLNYFNPNSTFYPFSLGSQDVNIISSNSNILSIDVNGNITVKGTGLATITLTSILNVVQSRVIYIYVVNYFDKNVSTSIFYTSNNLNGINITDGSTLNVYGNSSTNVYVVPTYNLSSGVTSNGDRYSISANGILYYENVSYNLSRNTQIEVPSAEKTNYTKTTDTSIVSGKEYFVYDEETDTYYLVVDPVADNLSLYYEQQYFSVVQINKQTLVFFKDKTQNVAEGVVDNYQLTPMLKTEIQIGSEKFEFYYLLDQSAINLNVTYKESATSIRTNSRYHSMQTNNTFKDTVTVISTNENELVFYQIFDQNGSLVQSRLPENLIQFDNAENREEAWLSYINKMNNKIDLFDMRFSEPVGNVFDFSCQVNVSGEKFLNRFENDIYGEYTVHLYCSELEDGVSYSFKILLNEAEINYISLNNFSNFNDVSVADEIVVPSQRGILEISLDPVEAVFEEFSITNNLANYLEGASEAVFTFAYEKINESSSKEFVLSQTFGRYENGTFKFTYQEMMDFYSVLNENFEDAGENSSVNYTGKVYISYYMPSNNVDDEVEVGFDVSVTYGNDGQYSMPSTIMLKTKLANYAKLTFADKEDLGGVYYVARGLSYNLNLDYYGFSLDQISITSTNNFIAHVEYVNGQHVLNVTSETINYNNEAGYKVEINTVATKTVENIVVTSTDTLTIYVMEYVLDYVYVGGVFEDIVRGMEDGVISTAIGNPYTLEFAIRDFLEYDNTNAVVNREVEDFVSEMTQNITWTVYLNDEPTELENNKVIRTDYYSINSFVVTPLRVYEAESDIYHFSASAYYTMRNGLYYYSPIATNANPIYTEFSFDVHQQSTQDSPIPVETYEELLEMQEDEWYILLNDIVLPSSEYAVANGLEQFSPINTNIAGLDGNGYYLQMSGTYSYDQTSDIGLFSSISEDTTLQNVTIMLTSDVVIRMSVDTFNIGLLSSTNNGIVTNCVVTSSTGHEGLSVICSTTAQSSYVSGLVANNAGYITNSRSEIDIFSNVNLSGFVGQNSGIISSSYYSDSSLKNETNTTSEFTAGFVVNNTGEIHTSYVSGEMSSNTMFYFGEEDSIQSSYNISGFVYTNSGTIEDCYSNITLRQSGAFASGFVYENSGNVERCFSTSVLESEQTSNYGFARYNDVETGIIDDCYYLSERDAEVGGQTLDINVSIGEITLNENTDIKPLTVSQFGTEGLEEFFSSYVVANHRDINSVWFFNEDAGDLNNFNGETFNIGRIELVAPNIVAYSQRELERIEVVVDETTGATYARYVYIYTSNSNPLGSVYNPILISDAESMENYILQENNGANYNYSYYRLIADIDYSEYLYNSKLYTTKFLGYLEGNFMTISGISLISSESMSSAGLFAELGNSAILDSVGTIMNFNLNPQAVSFSNTDVVGSVVGKVDGGNVYNINVTRSTAQQTVVVGNNIVGGVVGLAVGRYDIQNLYSQLSAKARYQSSSNNFNSNTLNYSGYSFAGASVGILSGTGDIYGVFIDTAVSVLADKAGLAFGLIDEEANVMKVLVEMQGDMLVNAYSYGGLVVGESKGIVEDVEVVGMNDSFTSFMKVPMIPTALGGFAGLLSGGVVSDISMTQSISISNENASSGVSYLGGVAGTITGVCEVSNVTVNADLVGFTYVGGVVGYVNIPLNTIYFRDMNVNANLYVLGHRLLEVGMGGLVGNIGPNSIINLGTTEDGKMNSFIVSANSNVHLYGTELEVFAGGVIGANKSVVSHTVSNCHIVLTGENYVYDMSESYTNRTTVAQVVETEVESPDGGTTIVPSLQIDKITSPSEGDGASEIQTIYATTLSSSNSEYYCNISFNAIDPLEKLGYYLRLNIHGSPQVFSV